ncbi:MAG: molybdopterin-dependent oxidoreductase [Lachnospiraceae bacterium]|nr:molybdopterin-dependent oxidoreductase [Lachnospiraceae bacterium]
MENIFEKINITNLQDAIGDWTAFSACEPYEVDLDGEEQIITTCCRACIANCGVKAHVKNGRVIKLEGNPDDPMSQGKLCSKGLSGIAALYHPNRNKYPLIRVGERGSGKWRRISWDQAMDVIGNKLMQVRKDYGAETVFCTTGGGGNPAIWSISRFANIFGTPNWFEPGCAQCYLPRVSACNMIYGGQDTSIADSKAKDLYDADNCPTKTLVLWGTDPSNSCTASGGRMVNELRARGTKTVVIDPRFTPDAAKADVWLPIRPGTDVALMLCWMNYIIENKKYDAEFVLKWTNLPYLVDLDTKYCLRAKDADGNEKTGPDGFMVFDKKTNSIQELSYPWDDSLDVDIFGEYEIDGKLYKTAGQILKERVAEFTLERTGEICCLEPERIKKALDLYLAEKPSAICLGVATDQTPNSFQAAHAADMIDMLVGNIEKPGTSLQNFPTSAVLHGATNPVPMAPTKLPPEQLPKRLGGVEHKGLGMWHAGQPAAVLDAILTGKPYKPRVWIDRSGNKMAVLGDGNKWEKAIHELDFIIHMYMYPTSFSAYADVLLPITEWLETNLIVEICNTLVARQRVAHVWETKDETVVWSNMAKKCAQLGHEGCQKAFDAEYMGSDLPYWEDETELFDTVLKPINMNWEEFTKAGYYEFMPKDEWKTYDTYMQTGNDGKLKGFNTPSKKLELYCDRLITLARTGKPYLPFPMPPASKDYDPLPYYMEPFEGPVNDVETTKEYPLTMTNGRVPFFHHSTLRNIPRLREMYPVPEIWINTDKAAELGIESGKWVWVESKRGKVRAKAVATENIGPNTVWMERFWFPETLNTETHGWKESNVSVLAKSEGPYNDILGTYTLRAYQVKVYNADSAPEGIWTEPADFKKWLPGGKF